ncbi:hypothetical protein TrLO_g6095 [Triparma laevis f. longispina]|uniref:Glutaredoxin domain-containing protein n=1 Tax=Triparma laevis f. longispina TaxID=1714387 RepID=A0A9W7CMC9_9STRA|nr:hypothetical protein TrLO_g6095 [Triparma laevis f. longispina]
MGALLSSSSSSIEDPAAFVAEKLKAEKPVLFSKSYCPSCRATKRLLDGLGVVYDLHELDSFGEPRNGPVQQALKKHSGIVSTPQLFFQGKFIGDNSVLQRMGGEDVKAALQK